MSLRFVDELPEPSRAGRRQWGRVRDELRTRPGQWAEVARFPKGEWAAAGSARISLAGRFPDIEARQRTVGGDVILFARAVAS